MSEVIVVIGPGSIGQAIARRVSAGKYVLLADLRPGERRRSDARYTCAITVMIIRSARHVGNDRRPTRQHRAHAKNRQGSSTDAGSQVTEKKFTGDDEPRVALKVGLDRRLLPNRAEGQE
jgi:NAD(P)-dependent dehydrogenase (short-subunit alcohol dehydrogenase family)